MSHEGNDKIIDQLIDEMNSDVIYEVTLTSEHKEVLEHWLLLIKQNLKQYGWKDNAVKHIKDRPHALSIGPVIEKQVTISELLEEKFDA